MKNLIIISCLFFVVNSYTQTQNIATDNPDTHIFPSSNSQHEVHISINKTDPYNLIVSANTYTNDYSQSFYVSIDGGIIWGGSDNLPNNGIAGGDPSTTFDATGRAYIAIMAKNGSQRDGYFIQHSDDKGLNWSKQVRGEGPTNGFDKEMIIAADEMQTSPYTNYLYCSWSDFNDNGLVKINRSIDGGNNYSNKTTLSSNMGQGTNVQIGPNGEVAVCWAEYSQGTIPADNIGFAISLDGGVNYTTTNAFTYLGIRTTDENPLFGNTGVNDFPSMAIDKSCGPHRGRIYITYPEFENINSSKSVIKIRYSDDNGATWSNSSTISIPNGSQSWFPWIAVDDLTGLVNVIYYSFDNPNSEFETNTYVVYSTDGFSTFQNLKVSDESHITAPIDNTVFRYGYAGDYIGIASYEGHSYAAWMDDRNETWQIYVSEINYDIPILVSSATDLFIDDPSLINTNRTYQAYNEIVVSNTNNVVIGNYSNIEMIAGSSVNLKPGFSTAISSNMSATYVAKIDNIYPCTTPGAISQKKSYTQNDVIKKQFEDYNVFLYPNPTTEYITIGANLIENNNLYNKQPSFQLYDLNAKLISEGELDVVNNKQIRKVINVNNLQKGIYVVTLALNNKIHSIKFNKL